MHRQNSLPADPLTSGNSDYAAPPPAQLELALGHAPETVRAHGLRAAHPRPLVSLGKTADPFRSRRVPPSAAWRFPSLQYADAGAVVAALALDCDRPDRLAAGLADLPDPNWIVRRKANQHAHAVWTLAKPVHKYPAARIGPLRFLAEIGDYYAVTAGADPAYSGLLVHNPSRHFREDDFSVTWGREEPHTLDGLASVIPFGWQAPKVRQTGIGRNADLFEAGMRWAGRRANANLSVLAALMSAVPEILDAHPKADHAFTVAEIEATAKQIEKYRARWAANGWHCPRWIARQAARGKASGKARREGSNEEIRPWEAEGISRRTWYRRRAAERGTRTNTDKTPIRGEILASEGPGKSLAEIAAHARANVDPGPLFAGLRR